MIELTVVVVLVFPDGGRRSCVHAGIDRYDLADYHLGFRWAFGFPRPTHEFDATGNVVASGWLVATLRPRNREAWVAQKPWRRMHCNPALAAPTKG